MIMDGTKTFSKSLYQNNSALGKGGLLIICLLQCFVVFWIHDIDLIIFQNYPIDGEIRESPEEKDNPLL